MYRYIVDAAYGWLTLSGILHFAVDVGSQHLRGKREPGLETTLYYGLNSVFSLGQVAFGLLVLFMAWRAINLLSETPALILSIATGLGWVAMTFLFTEYWERELNVGIFCVLIVVTFVMR